MQRGRIKEDLSDNFKELTLPGIINGYHRFFDEMTYANKAHTVMLYNQKIIEKDTAKKIIIALDDIKTNLKESDLSVDRGDDLYLNVESQLIERIGPDEGGRMHTARSRNDLMSTLNRMVVRRYILETVDSIIDLQQILYDMAEEYKNAVVTGYTHMQPAQPTTMGHYLLMCNYSLSRDVTRLINAYANTNRSALGAAAFAGTGFPIDRKQVSDLLGFDRIVENSWDCVTSRDYILEVEAAYAILENCISRMAQDIFIWCTDEFNVWELGGQISGQSSIMPQKKNPSTLETVKSGCSTAIGSFSSSFAALKNSAFSFILDAFRLDGDIDNAHKELQSLLAVFKETLRYSAVHAEKAERMADKNFCTSTGLADLLVRDFNISFRNAHHIVGGMVGDVKDAGKEITAIDSDALRDWSKKILGYEIKMTNEELHETLSARGNVASKLSAGGPSLPMVTDMLKDMKNTISSEEKWLNETKEAIAKAYENIEAAAKKITD